MKLWWSIYLLKVFYFLLKIDVATFYLFLNWFGMRDSNNRNVCSGRLYKCINTQKFKGLDSREITSLPEIKKAIYMACHFNHRQKYTAFSPQGSFAYNDSLQHATIAVLLIKIPIFFNHSVVFMHLFQSNQRFQVIEFLDWHVSEKL